MSNPSSSADRALARIERDEAAHRRTAWACTLATLAVLALGGWASSGFLSSGLSELSAASELRSFGARVDREWMATNGHGGTEVAFTGGNTAQRLTDDKLAQLKYLQHLRSVNLSGCGRITEAGLALLADLPELEELFLDGADAPAPQVTDRTLDVVSRLRHLRTLTLGGTRVTDAGIAKLAALKELEFLDLDDTLVTDACIPILMKLPHLKSLILTATQVTAGGILKLQQSRTDIDLVYDLSLDQPPAATTSQAVGAREADHEQ